MDQRLKKTVQITCWIFAIVLLARYIYSCIVLSQIPTAREFVGYADESISIAIILFTIYERWLWRINPFESTPKLKREYSGSFVSSYDNAEREAKLEIKQTLFTVQIVMTTKESKSKSLSSSIDDILGEKQLTYTYLNTPKTAFRHRSEIHYGTTMLTINKDGTLSGEYYTDRQTRGDMNFYPVGKQPAVTKQ